MFEIGSSLREARTRQGLDFDAMEQRTKVRGKYLRLIEEERFDQLPGPTYTKGFLRVYADQLGLDGQLYVDEFNSRFVAGEEDYAPRTRRVPLPAERKRRARAESRLVVVALAGIAVVTALVIAAWKFGGSDVPAVQGIDTQGRVAEPLERTVDADKVTLRITAAKGASYIEVREGDGNRAPLFSGTLERGKSQRFVGSSFLLSVRKPAKVVVRVNGERTSIGAGQLYVAAREAR
ncbi:MAG: helix-turn-helix domain-containing protein [Gaiella sp.]